MDDDEVRAFRVQVSLLLRRMRRESHAIDGLSRSAAVVVGAIARVPEPTPRAVGEDVRMTSSNVAAALREAEAAGLVHRSRDPDDARRTRLALTDHGQRTLNEAHAERDTWLGRAIHTVLDDGERATLRAAGALMERLAAYETEEPA